jgi:hypothetical protein
MTEQPPPTWLLISVLFSSVPLTAALAATLHQVAFALYTGGGRKCPVAGELVSGEVRSLGKDMLLGTIGGPAFEAELETERGPGKVRFLLTRQGLEAMGAGEAPAPRRAGRAWLN